jgi:hypothetical protein
MPVIEEAALNGMISCSRANEHNTKPIDTLSASDGLMSEYHIDGR